ncbi:uncharacterized protein [Antedon mediterranea]|uniref:uncharacterized protein isoform X2 n=1 Tax=Antedon mediterranea TaxID=105859 RepID=UPI003AF95C84
MFRGDVFVCFMFSFLTNVLSNKPEIRQLGCSSTTIQKYDCSWEVGINYQTHYDVIQTIPLHLPNKIPESNIIIDNGLRLLVKFRNKDYGNIGRQTITLNATNRYGSTSDSVEYYPKEQAIPLPPVGLQVKSKYHDYIEMSWEKPKGVILYKHMLLYRLQYKEPTAGEWRQIRGLKKKNFKLSDVEPFTEYEIQVSSKFDSYENQSAGWSEWSTKILTTTDMTEPGPSKTLRMTTTSYTNITSIHVTWLPPTTRNGPISKYYVRYKFPGLSWSSRLPASATWFDLEARCRPTTTGQYLVKVGIAAVNVALDGTEYIGLEAFVKSYVCSATNTDNGDDSSNANQEDDESAHKGIHTATVLIVDGPSPQQTDIEIFDELPRRRLSDLMDTRLNDLSLPHSSSGIGTSECISALNEDFDEEKHSESSYDDHEEQPHKESNKKKDEWPVAEDFSYVTTSGF